MVITKDYKVVIEKLVKSNKRYIGNEDLLEDFCAEALEKCLFILEKTDEIEKIESYLNKVVSTSMINVLKSSGRIARVGENYTNIAKKSVPLENPLDNGFLDIKDTTISFIDKIVREETIQEIFEAIQKFDIEYPEQRFGMIFYMKFVENKKQREIASYLGISQGEISKRLLDLMQKIASVVDLD